jgi:hypothetical protein
VKPEVTVYPEDLLYLWQEDVFPYKYMMVMAVDQGRNQSKTTAGVAYSTVDLYKLIYEYNVLLYSLFILCMHKHENRPWLAHTINTLIT